MTTKINPPPPLGTSALTDAVLAAMEEKERNFWKEVNELATQEIVANKAAGRFPPYTPSPELKKLLQSAVDEHKGLQYRQIRQLSGIFRIYC